MDEELIPLGAVLIKEGDEAVDLGLLGSEFAEDVAEAERVFAEGGARAISSDVERGKGESTSKRNFCAAFTNRSNSVSKPRNIVLELF